MDFAEGGAFEEFVKLVEDAKYKEAILGSESPRPDRKFPSLPRGFNYHEFAQENQVDLESMVNEPLGRFFFLQVSTSQEERDALAFADSLSVLRRMDPQGLVDSQHIIALCERHQMRLMPLEDAVRKAPATPVRRKTTLTGSTATAPASMGFSARATQRLIKNSRHSLDCIQLNAQAQFSIEQRLSEAHSRLTQLPANKRLFHLYLQLKVYSMRPLTEASIKYHRALGVGAFGIVFGCVVACVGTLLAMKIMNKKRIKAKKAMGQVAAERDALEALALHPSPYCLKLRYSFETLTAYHFVLPLAIAGDLQFHLKDGPFSLARARCYSAQVALGLGHIHSLGMIIRDLKPKNILLTSGGVCQLSDFGLAVQMGDGEGKGTKGRAGTEGYWSPEVINNLPYGVDADWWSFGVCLFEFLAGVCPFSAKYCGTKTRNDATRKGVVVFPPKFEPSAQPLVLALLDPKLESRVLGLEQVLDTARWAFWTGFDLDLVRRNEMPAPWLPEQGRIYAVSQNEIQENEKDETMQKIKILPQDAIPFEAFVDQEGHQRDICKVLEGLVKNDKLDSALRSVGLQACVVV